MATRGQFYHARELIGLAAREVMVAEQRPYRPLERSVDSVQRIYSVMLGLSFTESLRRCVGFKDVSGDVIFSWQKLVISGGLIALAIPFLHGMNRALDDEFVRQAGPPHRGRLLATFLIFAIEAVLFAMASICIPDYKSGPLRESSLFWITTLIGGIQLLDVLWCSSAWIIGFRRRNIATWFALSVLTLIFLMALLCPLPRGTLFSDHFVHTLDSHVVWIGGILALRTLFDYLICRTFYFPEPPAS